MVSSDGFEWTEEHLGRLGLAADSDIAQMLGIGLKEVVERRQALGIPRYRACPVAVHNWLPEEIALLGTMPDAAVAQ